MRARSWARFSAAARVVPARRVGCASPGARAPKDAPSTPVSRRPSAAAVAKLESLGHEVVETALPLEGWNQAFGPLVLAEERRERGDLLERFPDLLSDYVRKIVGGGADAQRRRDSGWPRGAPALSRPHRGVCSRPGTRSRHRQRRSPRSPSTSGRRGSPGARSTGCGARSPFAVPFNVSGNPAVSLPCGLADGLPVGLQLVMPLNQDDRLLDLAEDVEEALAFDRSLMGDPSPGPVVVAAS